MSVSCEVLQSHLAYTAWADERLMRAVEQIPLEHLNHDFQTADRSILGTLVHTFAGDRIWVRRVLGEPPAAFVTDEDRSLPALQRQWPGVLNRWQEWAATLQDPSAVISYRDMKGNPYESPAWEIVMHVVNHGTHHRGQVSGFLRTLGYVPPALDLIRYYRERG
ncbi:MAG TPA: DinB family protein [Candidatus Acidoferrales bacterium]|nr:DinB family protein [Candidatus Acidoferrales bacterium]